MDKKIVLSGMRPTGRLHLGNYLGALKNWVSLQDEYKCFFFVADVHALTTAYDRAENIVANSLEMTVDWLTAGLDPKKCVLFKQSDVPQISEITVLLGMITPLGMLLRNPTYKEQLEELFRKKYAGAKHESMELTDSGFSTSEKMAELTEQDLSELSSYGFLGYPVLMATDILAHQASFVPVGQDQTAHLEITRDIARKFNRIYGDEILTEPLPLFTKTAKVPGLDGRKMSKSYNNTIELGEDLDSVRKKIMSMFTDPLKLKAADPGHPEGCTVFSFHKIYNPQCDARREECEAGSIGCVVCKKNLFELMEGELKEFNDRRVMYASDKAQVEKILKEGGALAAESAQQTLLSVQKAMKLKTK